MDLRFEKGSLMYLADCEDALINSEIGRRYFAGNDIGKRIIREGIEQGNLYVAVLNDECVGFIHYIYEGAFHSFPYIRLVSIKEAFRGKGIGRRLLAFLEETLFKSKSRIFLCVADFNTDAKRFYERSGYAQVGVIPDLYKQGITEYLMMKKKESDISSRKV